MMQYFDAKHTLKHFVPGDRVLLRLSQRYNLPANALSKKLGKRYLAPSPSSNVLGDWLTS